jgi:tetratricopeptide (TPR) repeat protein
VAKIEYVSLLTDNFASEESDRSRKAISLANAKKYHKSHGRQPQQENPTSHDSTDAEALNVKGMNLVRTQQLRSALECFEKALRLNPNHSKAWYNKGMSLVSLGESKEEALHCFEKAIEINPLDPEAWNNKGAVLALLEKEQDALICYERALELKPSYALAWQNKGLLLLRSGNKKEAKDCFKNAVDAGLK